MFSTSGAPRRTEVASQSALSSHDGERLLYPLSDYGNAERLAARFAGVLRYTPGREWMAWSGQRWNRDLDGAAMRMVKETVRSIPDEFARADNPQDRAAACGFALKSESKARLQAALDLAQSERSLVVPSDAWDADRFLLAVANGTIDLRTGALRNHKPDDLITKLSRSTTSGELALLSGSGSSTE